MVVLDSDNDGRARMSEWVLLETADGSEQMFMRLDSNEDGYVPHAELSAPSGNQSAIRHMFRTFDHDNDGLIENEEALKARGTQRNSMSNH